MKKRKRKGHSKINDQIKRNIYVWITCHLLFVQSPISNDRLKVIFDDQTEQKLVTKLLLHMSFREPHNIPVSDTNDGGIKDDRYEENNIIISDSTVRLLLPPQSKKFQNDTR